MSRVGLKRVVDKLVEKWSVELLSQARNGAVDSMMQVAEMQHLKSGWGKIRHNPHQGRRWIEYAASKGHPLALYSLQSLIDRENANKDKRDQFMRQRFNQIAMNPIEHGYDDDDKRGAPKEVPRNFQSVYSRDGAKRALKAAMDERMQHTHADFPSRPITELIAQVDSFVPEMDDTYAEATAKVLTSNLDPNFTPRQFVLQAPEAVPADSRLNAQLALVERFEDDLRARKQYNAAKDLHQITTEDPATGRMVLTEDGLVPAPSAPAQFNTPWEYEVTDTSVPTLEKLRYFEEQAKHYYALVEKKRKDPKSVPQQLDFLEARAHTAHTAALVLGAKAYADQRTLVGAFDNKILDADVNAMRNLEERIKIMQSHEDREIRAEREALEARANAPAEEAMLIKTERDDNEEDLIEEPDAPPIGEQLGQHLLLRQQPLVGEDDDEEVMDKAEEDEPEDVQYVDLVNLSDSEFESANRDPLFEDGESLDAIVRAADQLESSPALEESDGDEITDDDEPITAHSAMQELNAENPLFKIIEENPVDDEEFESSDEDYVPELLVAQRQAPEIFPYVGSIPMEPFGDLKIGTTRMDDGAADVWPEEDNVHALNIKAAESAQLPYADSYLDDYGALDTKREPVPFNMSPEDFQQLLAESDDVLDEEIPSEGEGAAAAATTSTGTQEGADVNATQDQQQQTSFQQSAESDASQSQPRQKRGDRRPRAQQGKTENSATNE